MDVHHLPHANGSMGLAGTHARPPICALHLPAVLCGKKADVQDAQVALNQSASARASCGTEGIPVASETWEWHGKAPAFEPMHSTCPLFARKLAPETQDAYMAALWPERVHAERETPPQCCLAWAAYCSTSVLALFF